MAFGTSVPPRAYTREMLTTAFNWLQTQPENVRAGATTPDALVAMYMATHKQGGYRPSLETEAPVSSQAFMSDLKNLAEGLKEFDGSKSASGVAASTYSAPAAASPAAPTPVSTAGTYAAPVKIGGPAPAGLNERSLSMLREVQLTMNLSSETEAMNMMIALAYKNLKSVIA